MDRREFLALVTTSSGLFAGCASNPDQESTNTKTTTQKNPTDYPTPTERRTDTETETRTWTATPTSRTEVTDLSGTYTAAFYYPWYSDSRHWNEGYKQSPVLGEYSSRDPSLIRQHVSWASNYQLNAFFLSWWGPNSWEDKTIRDYFIPYADFGSIDFAILYETTGRLNIKNSKIDVSNRKNKNQLKDDINYLANKFFGSPGYMTINGRYPVFLYLSRIFTGDIEGVISDIRDQVDFPLYLIGDQVYWQSPLNSQSQAVLNAFDAVSAYNMHTSVSGINEDFISKVAEQYKKWREAAVENGTEFVPNVIPGFDDSAVRPDADHPVITRSTDRFSQFVKTVKPLTTDIPILSVTSFNEWHESTQIEPAKQYDEQYMKVFEKIS